MTPTVMRISPGRHAAFAAASLITLAELIALLSRIAPSSQLVVPPREPAPLAERVTFVVPRATSPSRPENPVRPPPASAGAASPSVFQQPQPAHTDSSVGAPVRDTPMPPQQPPERAPGTPASSPGSVGVSAGMTRGPVLAPLGFNPSAPLTRRVIDSVLDSLNAKMPALIWARVPTQAERDAAHKESAMAMRQSGRALLVPADPHLTPGFGLPSLFSRRKQRDAARARTDSILAENMARLARLRARARHDSLRRDSLQRADSARRAGSPAATLRRLPDARTPA